jgi:predicted component of type VI protein secretion system
VVVAADRDYYDRMRAAAIPGAPEIPFPAFYPERRFPLAASQLLIGRRSRKRGIEPDIDLTGPPEDAAVSHTHAVLVPGTDGWSVVDLDSANGTYLNGSEDQIEPNTPVPLRNGDRIHVGAWTTLTVQREESPS